MADNLPSWAQAKKPSARGGGNLPSWARKPPARKPRGQSAQQKMDAFLRTHPGWHRSGGFFHNLEGDIANSVHGFIPALVHTAEHPVGTTKQLAKAYAQSYGPLVHGNVSEFYKRFHAHPLPVLLDAAAIASMATGRGIALGTLPENATARTALKAGLTGQSQRARESLMYTLPSGQKVAGRTVSRSALRGARQKAGHQLLNELHPETPLVGEFARAARELKKQERTGLLARQVSPVLRDYLRAWSHLDAKERTAMNLLIQVPLHQDLAAWRRLILKNNDPVGMRLLRALDDPKVRRLYDEGLANKKLASAYQATQGLEALLRDLAGVDEAGAEARRFLPMQLARGATVEKDSGLVNGVPVDALRAELAAVGRPEPVYIPHVAKQPRRPRFARAGGGIAEPNRRQYQNQGVLFRAGLLAIDSEVLSPKYLRETKLAYHDDLHTALIDAARKLDPNEGLSHGWVWIRQKRGERIPHTQQVKGELAHHLDETFPVADPELHAALRGTTNAAEALTDEQGFRYAVPEAFAKQIAGEFVRSEHAIRLLVERPLQVWRALVLNLRVGWLTNNVLGNHILYALRFGGINGLRAYAKMIATTRGAEWLRKMFNMPETRRALTDADLRELLPEAIGGTFIGTQAPTTGFAGRVNDLLSVFGHGLAPIDRATEGALRRAAANALLSSSPEVKQLAKAMPKQERSFRAAARQALDDPKIRREVVDEINNTLGNFLDMSPFERGVLRNLIPFWAWYKAIAKVTLKLPANLPVRTAILARLDLIGEEWADERIGPVPTYLKGAVPVGSGIFKTQAVNPFETPVQSARALGAFTPLASRQGAYSLLGEINPFLPPTFDYLGRLSRGETKGGFGLPGEITKGIGAQLPFGRLANPPHRRRGIYTDYGRLPELLGYLGVGYRHLNKPEARRQARQGR